MNYVSLEDYSETSYTKVRRNAESYEATEKIFTSELIRIYGLYKTAVNQQEKRLLRDLTDFCIRRYQNYSIKERIRAHYIQVDCHGDLIFEHLIPASIIRDLFLSNKISVLYALNSPTVILTRENDKKLNKAGLVSSSADLNFPFKRYLQAGINTDYVTFTGIRIENPLAWSLKDHYKLVGLEASID